MNKETVEYWRNKGSIKGYGYIFEPKILSKTSILDFLVEWCKKKGEDIKIIDHALRKIEENDSTTDFHYAPENPCLSQEDCAKILKDKPAGSYEHNMAMIGKIPKCDDVYYLDIWFQ